MIIYPILLNLPEFLTMNFSPKILKQLADKDFLANAVLFYGQPLGPSFE